jgi:microcystin-dependent protein
MDMFIGTIIMWPMDWAPQDWALCQGQTLQITQYQALYSLIGCRYGGDGRTTFALPDLRGRIAVGMGQSTVPGVRNWNLGDVNNSTGQVSLAPTNVPLPAHTHSITNTVNCTGGGNVPVSLPINVPVNPDSTAVLTNVPTNNMLATAKTGMNPSNIYTSSTTTTVANLKSFNAQGNITVPAPTVTVTSTCSPNGTTTGTPVNIMPNLICMNYIICLNGLYPQRP